MDPGFLDSSLPQPDNPCLIVEDSQPDSGAPEDDPESSYRALLARRLSTLQPSPRSPVLELISSPPGTRSQTDSESSQRCSQTGPEILPALQEEESQVLHICPPPTSRAAPEGGDMDSRAESTARCCPSDEGTSQFGFLELSQSQDLCSEAVTGLEEESQPERRSSSAEQSSRAPVDQDHTSARSEGEQLDRDVPSSQEDMFDAEKTGAAVHSTVPERQGHLTPTPSRTLRLLHLSGQVVQDSLSQSSADYVAPTPERHTPLIGPTSPTEQEQGERTRPPGSDEPVETSLPPDHRAGQREEHPMEAEAASKPHPSASTPLSQNSPGFALDRSLSLPSQPELSHDVFVPTPSLEPPQAETALGSPPQLSVNSQSGAPLTSEQDEDDSQATQIEEFEDPLTASISDSETRRRDCPETAESPKHLSKCAETAPSHRPHRQTASLNANGVNVPDGEGLADTVSCSQLVSVDSCVQETPCSVSSQSVDVRTKSPSVESMSRPHTVDQLEEVMEEEPESAAGGGALLMALALSQSQLMSPEPMEDDSEEQGADGVTVVTDGEKRSATSGSQPITVASTNGHEPRPKKLTEGVEPEPEALKDKSLSDSSGEISFHFTLPKEGELIGPAVGATPPLVSQLKQTLRHSTPIEVFTDAMAASDVGGGAEDRADPGDRKLSLRMKLVTPVGEGSSESFSLQKPALSGEDAPAVEAVTGSSVFSRVRQVHRQQEGEQPGDSAAACRAELFASPQRTSQASSLGCNSRLEPSQQEATANSPTPADQSDDRRRLPAPPGPLTNTVGSSPSVKLRQRALSQQTGGVCPAGRAEAESPSSRRGKGPAHCRHVRTIQEVRTTVTRIITDVYYEDGKEVDRKVTEENEEPVVDCHVLDSDVSPCRTGSSSLTSGDLGDISSLSSKASSLQHSSGGAGSGGGFTRPDFVVPSGRGGRSSSPRRGGGYQQRGHRGQRAGSVVTKHRGFGTLGARAFVPLTPRGRARRGRPPSRSSLSRRGGVGSLQRLGAHGRLQSSSEEDPFTRTLPPRLPVSPSDTELLSPSDSLRSSPEEASSAGSSFVGLRVVAKWSSNGYFYSGRIIGDAGEGTFRLRFDDGYECEVVGKDILLCDPIPLETEVTALLEDEYFSIGVVRGHKSEGQELFYSVEQDGQRQWYNRTSVILSLEQGNKLREQHSLGPYEPSTPLAKASDISLDNLVEGKRRRRVTPGGQDTPNRSSSSSPRTPGPSGKRKLRTTSEDDGTAPKRGRRGPGVRAAQRVGVCNTSGSGTDLPGPSAGLSETQGPQPQNTSLFMGFAFMLTVSSESDRLTNRLTEEEEEQEEEEEDRSHTGSFNKAYTESQLQAGGGFILPDFNEEQCKAAYQSLLIADQHCRTRKYLLCLASGVPCVSYVWVRDCCKENKLLNYRNYLLPAGVGPDNTVVEWHPRCSPFRSLRVLLVFEEPAELWAQLITMGGASSVRQLQVDKDGSDLPAGKYDAVVTDHACPPLVEKSVTSQEVPLVSTEWLIQSVICGECLAFHSRPQYRHDYSS